MRQRCNDAKCSSYRNYGAKGISVCDEWDSFQRFAEWSLVNGYDKSLTIERIDVTDGYSPDNCTWVDRTEQALNRSTASKIGHYIYQRASGNYSVKVKRKSLGTFKDLDLALLVRDEYLEKVA